MRELEEGNVDYYRMEAFNACLDGTLEEFKASVDVWMKAFDALAPYYTRKPRGCPHHE